MGISGGSSSGSSSSQQYGYSQSLAENLSKATTDVYQPQQAALAGLWGDASALAGQQQQQIPGIAGVQAAQGLDNIGVGINAARDLATTGGRSAAFADPNNDLARRQLAAATADINDNLTRQILPGQRSISGMAGGMGNSRDMIARGVAMGDASRAVAQAGTEIYSRQYEQAAQMAGQADTNRLSGAGALPGLSSSSMSMALSPMSAAWAPISSLAQAIGSPTLVSNSSALSRALSGSENWGSAKSQSRSSQWGVSLF